MSSTESITFKCDPAFAEWLRREAFELDKSASEVIRACIIIGLPVVKSVRGLDRVCLDDVRLAKSGQ